MKRLLLLLLVIVCVEIFANHDTRSPVTLTRANFEQHVLASPSPWVVAFSNATTPEEKRFIHVVTEFSEFFKDFVNVGLVNSSREDRLTRRFNAHHVANHTVLGGVVIGFQATAKGLGSNYQVLFSKWAAISPSGRSFETYFQRRVRLLLPNFVKVLSTEDEADSFFRYYETTHTL